MIIPRPMITPSQDLWLSRANTYNYPDTSYGHPEIYGSSRDHPDTYDYPDTYDHPETYKHPEIYAIIISRFRPTIIPKPILLSYCDIIPISIIIPRLPMGIPRPMITPSRDLWLSLNRDLYRYPIVRLSRDLYL
jgi:hypothetical protein